MLALLLAAPVFPVHAQEASVEEQGDAPRTPELGRVRFVDVPVPLGAGAGQESVVPDFVAEPVPALGEMQVRQRRDAIADYNARVTEIETAGGAWDQALAEELAALGRTQQGLREHEAAIATLDRALHVNRINAGLHTLEQVPVVEAMIDSYTALGNWSQADLYQNYLYFVQHRAYGLDDPRMIPVLEKLGRWNLEAFTIGLGEPLGMRLATAQLLFNIARRLVGTHFGTEDERYVSYLRHVARSAYLVALHSEFVAEAGRPQYRVTREQLQDALMASGPTTMRGFASGVEALQEIVAFYEEGAYRPYLAAEAIANLADWHLLFDRRNTARRLYAQAWEILAGEDNGRELQARLFGQVVPIPTFAELPTNLLLGASSGRDGDGAGLSMGHIDVRLSVTDFGALRGIEVLSEKTEANANQFSQLRREIRNTVFRPLLMDGELVASEGHVFRYRYWY